MNNSHSKQSFDEHVKKIKIEIHPKMIMIWTYENIVHFKPSKVHQRMELKVKGIKCASSINKVQFFPLVVIINIIITIISTF